MVVHARWIATAVVTLAIWGEFFLGRPLSLVFVSLLLVYGLVFRPCVPLAALKWPAVIAPLLLYALSYPYAFDRQWALSLGFLFPLALATWTLGAVVREDWAFWRMAAVQVAMASLVALNQALGGLPLAPPELSTLPESLQVVASARLATGRAFGTLPLPGHFAVLQAFAAPFLVQWVVGSRGWRRMVPLAFVLLSLGGCIATLSLLGTALWLLGALLVLGVEKKASSWAVAVGLFTLALLAFLRHDLPRLEPLALRWVNWKVAAWVFWQNPISGVGLGGVGLAGLTSPWAAQNITPFAHNTPLQLIAEFGVIGLPGVALLLYGAFRLVSQLWSAYKPAAVALLIFLVHNVFDFSFYQPALLLAALLLAGSAAPPGSPLPRGPRRFLALLLVGVVGLAALEEKSQKMAVRARRLPPAQRVSALLQAASFTPWRLAEVFEAAGIAWDIKDKELAEDVDHVLVRRAWVAPTSATWCQARALLLMLRGRRAEAWAWAREATQRAPWRRELWELEHLCRP